MVLRLQRAGIGLSLLIASGCVSYPPRPYPWNFPPEHEWNAPLETSWVNAVDAFRNWTAPKGRVWNPLIRQYEPDFGSEIELLKALPPDTEEHELYQ
jgi:hypothetical protein